MSDGLRFNSAQSEQRTDEPGTVGRVAIDRLIKSRDWSAGVTYDLLSAALDSSHGFVGGHKASRRPLTDRLSMTRCVTGGGRRLKIALTILARGARHPLRWHGP